MFPNNSTERGEKWDQLDIPKKESVGRIKGAIQGLKPSLWMAVELNEGVRKPPVPSPSLGFQGPDSLFCYNLSSSSLHCPLHRDRVMKMLTYFSSAWQRLPTPNLCLLTLKRLQEMSRTGSQTAHLLQALYGDTMPFLYLPSAPSMWDDEESTWRGMLSTSQGLRAWGCSQNWFFQTHHIPRHL